MYDIPSHNQPIYYTDTDSEIITTENTPNDNISLAISLPIVIAVIVAIMIGLTVVLCYIIYKFRHKDGGSLSVTVPSNTNNDKDMKTKYSENQGGHTSHGQPQTIMKVEELEAANNNIMSYN